MNINTIKLLSQLFDTKSSTTPCIQLSQHKPLFTPTGIVQPFPRATPESQGLSSKSILSLLQALSSDPTLNMHSLLIIRNGYVITEAAWPGQDLRIPKMTFSACKSITSLAIGMLINEGRLQLDTRLIDLWPDKVNPLDKIRLRDMTIRHLLTMTSGFSFNEGTSMTETDWVKGTLNSSIKTTPFSYNSLNSYLLSAAVTRITGLRLSEYLKPRLFDPLDIHNFHWETCPMGIDKGGWGLYLTPEDFGKIGWLLLQKGLWKGQRLLPESWILEATKSHAEAPKDYGDFNYGYHIWRARENTSFLFNGMLGQNVLCMPDSNMVIVSNAGNDENFQKSRYFDCLREHLSDIHDSLKPDRHSYKALLKYTHALCKVTLSDTPIKQRLPRQCKVFSQIQWYTTDTPAMGLSPMLLQTIQNNYTKGLTTIGFAIRGGTFILDWTEADELHSIAIGWKKAAISNISIHGEPYRIAASGSWASDENGRTVLKVQIHFQETPFTRLLRFYWEPDRLILRCEELPGESFLYNSLALFLLPISNQPILGAALEKVDTDYIDYKIKQVFSPEIILHKDNPLT